MGGCAVIGVKSPTAKGYAALMRVTTATAPASFNVSARIIGFVTTKS